MLVVMPLCALAGHLVKGSSWTDGFMSLRVSEMHDGKATMIGGTLHEGGYEVMLVSTGTDGEYIVQPAEGGDQQYCSFGGQTRYGDKVTEEEVNGIPLLVSRGSDGTLKYVLQQLRDDGLHELVIGDILKTYAGQYVDDQGRKWQFSLEGTVQRPGDHAFIPFTIMECYDMPCEVIKFGPGDYARVKISTTGLNLYHCAFDEATEEYNTDGALMAKLRRTGTPWGNQGLCPLTAIELLTCSMAAHYDKPTLRILRNEIWARHGYVFQSSDLQRHFDNASWYHPNPSGNSTITLSPVEQMNVDILRSVENNTGIDWVTTEPGL